MMRSMFVLVALLFGCAGDDIQTTPDANLNLPACTGVAYDSCTDTTNSSDCMNGMTCRLFRQDGFTICTPTCDADNPCPPDQDGSPVSCNQMGRCKGQPNACTP